MADPISIKDWDSSLNSPRFQIWSHSLATILYTADKPFANIPSCTLIGGHFAGTSTQCATAQSKNEYMAFNHYGICANELLDEYEQSDSSIECHQGLLQRRYETQCLNQIPFIKDIIETHFIKYPFHTFLEKKRSSKST